MKRRMLNIKIAKWLGYKSHSDMDFGSYLTRPQFKEGRMIDYCPPSYQLYGSEDEAWLYGTPHYVEWVLLFLILTVVGIVLREVMSL